MKPIPELVRNLSKQHRDIIAKARAMADKMIKTAEAAKTAVPKK